MVSFQLNEDRSENQGFPALKNPLFLLVVSWRRHSIFYFHTAFGNECILFSFDALTKSPCCKEMADEGSGYGDAGMRVTMKRLQRLNDRCGGGKRGAAEAEPEVDFSQMTPYGAAQYRITDKMRLMRVYITQLDELGPRATPTEKVEISQKIRKEEMKVKKEMIEAKALAVKEKKQQDFETLQEHVKKTQSLYRARFGGPADEVAASSYGSTNSRYTGKLSSVELDSDMGSATGGYSLRDDDEFQQFFQQVQKNDAAMDQALDRIGAGVLRLQDQALGFKQELKVQSTLIDETERKVDDVSTKMKGLNKKLKQTIKQVDQDKMCCYLLCFIIVLGLAGGIYFVIEKK